ncbi:hypothetical protein M1M06_07480 [Ralstonia insidiosa]|uniref:hypothetical protein n=2 Tax=Pseudomonadota TaxID=1224 RepID=UPI0010F9C0D5|nr:hypothetical protein [Ralstonia insidiosa]MCK8648884.1 hypothetical protein [Ralstonia insidiosa]
MKFLVRAQEWLADRVSWVQYPNIRQIPTRHKKSALLSLPERIIVGMFGLFLLGAGTIAMAAGAFVLYLVLSSLF